MGKYTYRTEPLRTVERTIGAGSIEVNGVRFPVFYTRVDADGVPSTVTIVNKSTAGAGWTAVAHNRV